MAVSKASLLCVKGKVAKDLIKGIKGTKINMDTIKSCNSLIEQLEKGELLKKDE